MEKKCNFLCKVNFLIGKFISKRRKRRTDWGYKVLRVRISTLVASPLDVDHSKVGFKPQGTTAPLTGGLFPWRCLPEGSMKYSACLGTRRVVEQPQTSNEHTVQHQRLLLDGGDDLIHHRSHSCSMTSSPTQHENSCFILKSCLFFLSDCVFSLICLIVCVFLPDRTIVSLLLLVFFF